MEDDFTGTVFVLINVGSNFKNMRKVILQLVKATFPVIAGCSAFIYPACAQQNIIANKDNTRPGVTAQATTPARITSFNATHFNGYNEIQWTAVSEQDTRRFIIEYSANGIDFQTASEMLPFDGSYSLKHQTYKIEPLLYRIRIEKTDGKFYNSVMILLDGADVQPVYIYPTIVKGSTINARAGFPVERTSIVSLDGRQLFAQDIGGQSGYLNIPIPSLQEGIYWMTFYGNGWKTTSKFVIAD